MQEILYRFWQKRLPKALLLSLNRHGDRPHCPSGYRHRSRSRPNLGLGHVEPDNLGLEYLSVCSNFSTGAFLR